MITMKIKISKYTLDKTSTFDIIICVVGYEKRSSYIPTLGNNVNIKIAIAFEDNNVLNYDSNMKRLKSANYIIVENDSNKIDTALSTAIRQSLSTNKRASIVIDISSMTRKMIAILLQWFKDYEQRALLDLIFAYASAKFIKLNEDIGPITITEPVIPEFAGWPIDPDLPSSGIIGLGYEYNRALAGC